MEASTVEDRNERPDICGPCGGECCRTRPGFEAPERFLRAADPAAHLAAALASGEWLLARHVGVPWRGGVPPPDEVRWREILCPRPATVEERRLGRAFASGERSPCVFLEERGCRLAFAERPRMCRSLEPSAAGECLAAFGPGEAAAAWLPHQALVEEARRRAGVGR
ncbi:MAG: hypothetical protein HZB56_14965 [Deltaproteobacteria bacterium]|nr:hypothetical protein [Deltaproteobacteria bacterium]